jgi:myo-inositol-1-phosphate synthase
MSELPITFNGPQRLATQQEETMTQGNSTSTGVLFVGLGGAVATTVVGGVFAIQRAVMQPIGLVTEDDQWEALDFLSLNSLVFGGWDVRSVDLYTAATEHQVIPSDILPAITDDLKRVTSWAGVAVSVDQAVANIANANGNGNGSAKKFYVTRQQGVAQLMRDIAEFRRQHRLDQVIVINTTSTEPPVSLEAPALQDLVSFEAGIKANDPAISTGMIYAYAALKSGCPYINFTPNTTVETPALLELAEQQHVPVAGKDGKTGQTMYKTIIGPMLAMRRLRLRGWYSTNILGNRDGQVLHNPDNLESKIQTKSSVLSSILGYDDFTHVVRIDYFPPSGDAKEAWDHIVFKGWLGEEMSLRINWQGKDSPLAAPLIVDLLRLVELGHRQGLTGVLQHCACFFKAPYHVSEHNMFVQYEALMRYLEESVHATQHAVSA